MNEFEEIWKLKPKGKSRVWVYNKETDEHEEKQIFRSYRTYLTLPPKDKSVPKSWMNDELEPEVPEILQKYVDQTQEQDARYNSMVVNWYEANDFIEPHRDCDNYMVDDYSIKIYSLGEVRPITFTSVHNGGNISEQLDEPFEFSSHWNRNFRHSVDAGEGRRISLTFRMLDLYKCNQHREN